ncbi:lipid droplet-associated protein [Haloechinothrix sp. LS1_15]|uniref:lipid droplet-associated protein n=1 Tax=Haloechinothrix sp. LS1_15 TaxID=2652248 RepID=UPI00294576BA|nr:lipid droplet-associated protein [Haloechinothrix sp. LS1_15]MDV6011537.1 lipid droplet-associated protein [Haloechinothrix sp. LS1_15]
MKSLPLPVRVATGLAVSALEHARDLPRQLTGLPVTVASHVMQLAMRLQQQVTELAVKGDEALAELQEPQDDTPSWATFDEDLPGAAARPTRNSPGAAAHGASQARSATNHTATAGTGRNGHASAVGPSRRGGDPELPTEAMDDPWAEEERALAGSRLGEQSETDAESTASTENTGETGSTGGSTATEGTMSTEGTAGPSWLPQYGELTLPQVRARLRQLTAQQVEELLAYEQAHANRASFTGMLSRRIATLRRESGEGTRPESGS